MTSGYVMFRLGERSFATPLDEVREIVRLTGVHRLPGAQKPVAGVIVVRGIPLPVVDLRAPGAPDDDGDVLVIDVAGGATGVAVDAATAVLRPDELAPVDDGPTAMLPSYVVSVRRHAGVPVLVVDLNLLLDVTAPGWSDSLRPLRIVPA
jgi:chemotaxis signal transduction protein